MCESDLDKAESSPDKEGESLNCPSCQKKVSTRKIKYLIENGLMMDYEERCPYCQGPTLHRQSMNLGHRCFYFPQCSGQAGLFGNQVESLVFLDFETSGLEPGRDAIIEIGALKIDEEGYEHTFKTFVSPKRPLPPKITKITGITDEMLVGAPDINATIEPLVSFMGSAKLVAHNADFDIPWLIAALIKTQHAPINPTVICTLKWARASGETSAGLGALTKKYKIGHANAHRALADAAATKELFFIYQNIKKSPRPECKLKDYWSNTQKIVEKYHQYAKV